MNKTIVCQIHDLSHEGLGVGKVNDQVIFVEGALPAEEVDVKITESKPKYLKGQLLRVLKPSPNRIDPICPIFENCGGCQIMHLDYDAQLKIKKNRITSQLTKIGKFENPCVLDVVPSDAPFYYRNKIQLHHEKGLGFYKKHSHEIVELDTCYIAKPLLNQLIHFLNQHQRDTKGCHLITIRCSFDSSSLLVIFHTKEKLNLTNLCAQIREDFPQVKGILVEQEGRPLKVLFGQRFYHEKVLDVEFKMDAAAFLQVNLPQAEKLYYHVIKLLGSTSDFKVLDAYCGIGILSCLLAQQGARVLGVEFSLDAVESARENATLLGLNHVEFIASRMESMTFNQGQFQVVILNPPRGGCERVVLDQIVYIKPGHIIYVSCDPATLSRDLKILKESGYELIEAQPFDLFPQTMHVETVAYLKMRS
jgi:23S rRNA (uracil1939-C5)-methyltransferase